MSVGYDLKKRNENPKGSRNQHRESCIVYMSMYGKRTNKHTGSLHMKKNLPVKGLLYKIGLIPSSTWRVQTRAICCTSQDLVRVPGTVIGSVCYVQSMYRCKVLGYLVPGSVRIFYRYYIQVLFHNIPGYSCPISCSGRYQVPVILLHATKCLLLHVSLITCTYQVPMYIIE